MHELGLCTSIVDAIEKKGGRTTGGTRTREGRKAPPRPP